MDQVPNLSIPSNLSGNFNNLTVGGTILLGPGDHVVLGGAISNSVAATPISVGLTVPFSSANAQYVLEYNLWISGPAAAAGGVKFSYPGTGPSADTSLEAPLAAGGPINEWARHDSTIHNVAVCTFDMSTGLDGKVKIIIVVLSANNTTPFNLLFAPGTDTQNMTIRPGSYVKITQLGV